MQNIKVGCIPVRQVVRTDAKALKIKKFIKNNILGLMVGGISTILLATYSILIMNFIKLIKIVY